MLQVQRSGVDTKTSPALEQPSYITGVRKLESNLPVQAGEGRSFREPASLLQGGQGLLCCGLSGPINADTETCVFLRSYETRVEHAAL